MLEIVRSDAQKKLSVKQQQAISLFVQGKSQGDIAGEIGVDPKTLWRWRHDSFFQAELRLAEDRLFDESISMLKRTMKAAILCLVRNMGETCPHYTQVQAASKLLDAGVEVHKISQLEDKIAVFESLAKEAGLK